MARRRMIDPDIWEDEKFSQLDFAGRLFFIGLITQANDYGKLRGNSKILKTKIFPYDNQKIMIEEYIKKLNELRIIQIYEANGEKFIKIKNWNKYQTLTYKGRDLIPEPKDKSLTESEETLNKPLINPEEIHNQPLTVIEDNRIESNISKENIKEENKKRISSKPLTELQKIPKSDHEILELARSLKKIGYSKDDVVTKLNKKFHISVKKIEELENSFFKE